MADRFWVGGAGTWNTTSTTNWSASSGGPSGASVPTVADSVFFNQAGTYTVTMTGALNCLDITVSAGTVTFATGTTPTLQVRGSMSLVAGTVWITTAVITFSSTTTGRTITTNGTLIGGAITFNGVGGEWILGSALTSTSGTAPLTVIAGTFDTSVNSYAVSVFGLDISGFTARTVKLNASTVTITGTGSTAINATITNLLTFNVGTSQINLTANGSGIEAGTNPGSSSLTFYNVAFTNTTAGTRSIAGSITFNNFAVAAPASAGVVTVNFPVSQTINGTLSTTGTAGNRRVFFTSANLGIAEDLVVNSAPSLTDADFRGLYIRGTAAPISGTRIGNRGECRGITFSTSKTVYWNLAGAQNWAADGWATTPTGTPSTNNFPLPQDTATFTNAGSVTGTITVGNIIPYVGTIDMSGRTTAMTLATGNPLICYGNWTNGSGTTFTNSNGLTFSGGGTQIVTTAGKTMATSAGFTINTYGGTVQLADALSIGSNPLTVTNGTFNTAGFSVTAGTLASTNTNVRTISLGASTLTLGGGTPVNFGTFTNLTLNAGTSQINCSGSGSITFSGGGQTFHNVSYTGTGTSNTFGMNGANTFNNLTVAAPASVAITSLAFSANQAINGTLTCSGASAVRRIFLGSSTIGTPRTLTVNAISATDCDFQDINLAGAASGASPTRAGDCGGNTGITFPSPKTVYYNLAGANNWSATAWAPSSGGTPDINLFPLAQDTAVFDNTGSSAGTITIERNWNIGTFDSSLRTNATTLSVGSTLFPDVYGDWKFGTGVTLASTAGTIVFAKGTTQTITSNGVLFGCNIVINHPRADIQLADALSVSSLRTFTLTSGTFNAVTYNVTTGQFSAQTGSALRMGAGTWTLSGSGDVWSLATSTLIVGTSTIVLSNTAGTARVFSGGNQYYNKLTIGAATGTSTLTINGSNTFGELASTKTVAHTIDFGGNTTTFGKWSVTGTAGNVVTITGTSTTNVVAGPAVTGVDYLAMGTWGISTISPGEFYAGANSTGTAAAPVFKTAAPAPRTLYWVGGTGNWSNTSDWDTTSGGPGGAAIPTSLDAVIFNSASNATSYTATVDAGVTMARCAGLTMDPPASGTVTFAGTAPVAFHGNTFFAASGVTRTIGTGGFYFSGNSAYTFTGNGTFSLSVFVSGVGSTWTLGGNLAVAGSIEVTYGTLDTSASGNYSISGSILRVPLAVAGVRSIKLNGSSVTLTQGTPSVGLTPGENLLFDAGTSSINMSVNTGAGITASGQTFYNVSFTSTTNSVINFTGSNTFNDVTIVGRGSSGVKTVNFTAPQTINGTLTVSAGATPSSRTFLRSSAFGTPITLSVASFAAGSAEVDFCDITIAGAAAPISGTRFGDCKGNSGITFPASKTVYLTNTTGNWGTSTTWAATPGGGGAATNFPLAQDVAVVGNTGVASQVTVDQEYAICTVNFSARTSGFTFNTGTLALSFYGNWIGGTGVTISSSGTARIYTFSGRGSNTITSAGRTFTTQVTINSPGGSVTLQDAFVTNRDAGTALTITAGTFDANGYNVTLSGPNSGGVFLSGTAVRTVAMGNSTWAISGGGGGNQWDASVTTNLTVTGAPTVSFSGLNGKQFAGGGYSYPDMTIRQASAPQLTITGDNRFKTIVSSAPATTFILLGSTTQTFTDWSGTGASGANLIRFSGTSSASPAKMILSGTISPTVDFLLFTDVLGYPLNTAWYVGANSINNGSLGIVFAAGGGVTYNVTVSESASLLDVMSALGAFRSQFLDAASGQDAVFTTAAFGAQAAEQASAADAAATSADFGTQVSEQASAADATASAVAFSPSLNEVAEAADAAASAFTATSAVSESAQAQDSSSAAQVAAAAVDEQVTGLDQVATTFTAGAQVQESAQPSDAAAAQMIAISAVDEAASGADTASSTFTVNSAVSEDSQVLDASSAAFVAASAVAEQAAGQDQTAVQFSASALAQESATAADSASTQFVAKSSVSETARPADQAQSNFTVGASVSDTGRPSDAASASYVAQSQVNEQLSVTDSASSAFLPRASVSESTTVSDADAASVSFRGVTAETARGSDQTSTRAVFSAQVLAGEGGTTSVTENTSAYPLGTSFTGSQFFGASSAGNAVSVVANGTGTGTAGGFAAGGNQIRFGSGGGAGARTLTTVALNLTTAVSVTLNAISGNNSNGGELPDSGENLVLQYSLNGTTYILIDSLMVPGNPSYPLSPTFSNFVKTVPLAARTASTFLRVQQATASSGTIDNYGIRTITVTRTGGGGSSVGVSDSVQAGGTYNAPFVDTARVSDTAVSRFIARSVIQESAQAQDTVVRLLIVSRSVSEAAQAADQVAAGVTFRSAFQDAARALDALQAQFLVATSVSEAARGSDQVASRVSFLSQVFEALSAQDSVARQLIVPRSIDESATEQDQVQTTATFESQSNEAAQVQDTVARQLIVPRSIDESATAQDQVQARILLLAQVLETVLAQDSVARQLVVPRSINEASTARDQVQTTATFESQSNETAQAQDTVARQLIVPRSIDESATAQDQAQARPLFPVQVIETAQAQDTVARQLIVPRSINEASAARDQETASAVFQAATQDSAAISDAETGFLQLPAQVAESSAISDRTVGVRVFFGRWADTLEASEQVQAQQIAGASVGEIVRGRDSVQASAVFLSSVSELGRATDLSVGFIVISVSLQELAAITEASVGFITFPAAVVDAASGQAQAATRLVFAAQVAEQLTALDALDAPGSVYNAQILEISRGADDLFLNGIYNAAVGEALVILDQAAGSYLWNLIDDSQDANWQNVPAVQVADWVQVDDTQTTNWQNVPSSQVAGWVEIDTENVPNWQQEPPP